MNDHKKDEHTNPDHTHGVPHDVPETDPKKDDTKMPHDTKPTV